MFYIIDCAGYRLNKCGPKYISAYGFIIFQAQTHPQSGYFNTSIIIVIHVRLKF